jgi:hypothetical protein
VTRVCTWCKRVMGTKPGGPDSMVSHGICRDCLKKVRAEASGAHSLPGPCFEGGRT